MSHDFDGFVADIARKQNQLPRFGKKGRGRDRAVGGLFSLQRELSKMEMRSEADPIDDFVIDPFSSGKSGRPQTKPKRKRRTARDEDELTGLEGLDEAIELGLAEASIASMVDSSVESLDFLRGFDTESSDGPELDLL